MHKDCSDISENSPVLGKLVARKKTATASKAAFALSFAAAFALAGCGGGGSSNVVPVFASAPNASSSEQKDPAQSNTQPGANPPAGGAEQKPTQSLLAGYEDLAKMYHVADIAAADGTRVMADLSLAEIDYYINDYKRKENSMDRFQQLFFVPGWNESVREADMTAVVYDSGMRPELPIRAGFEGHYSYDKPGFWMGMKERTTAALHDDESKKGEGYWRHIDYEPGNTHLYKYKDPECEAGKKSCPLSDLEPIAHGSNVATIIANELPNSQFVNVISPSLPYREADGKKTEGVVDDSATIDHATYNGVRFINRSVANEEDHAFAGPGVYYPAIMHYNTLVISGAANNLMKGDYTFNGLMEDSVLRDGWIVVTGFGPKSEVATAGQKTQKHDPRELDYRSEAYYVVIDGQEVNIYPWGNSCKRVGMKDCISAPFWVSIDEEHFGSGTSYSSPLVTATAMSVQAKFPWMSNKNIKQTLFSTAYEVHAREAKDEANVPYYFGVGAINPRDAIHGPASFGDEFVADVSDGLFVFSNKIKGNGKLVKDGVGTLALSADNDFTGQIDVYDGELWLLGKNSSAELVNAARTRLSGATLASVTNSALLVSEGFAAGSLTLSDTSKLAINLGEMIEISGKASLAGELAVIGASAEYVPQNEEHTEKIITAGSIEGKFSEVKSQSALLEISQANYEADGVSLQIKATESNQALAQLSDYAKANYQSLIGRYDFLAEQKAKNPSELDSNKLAAADDFNVNGGETLTEYVIANDASASNAASHNEATTALRTGAWLQTLDAKALESASSWLFADAHISEAASQVAIDSALINSAFNAASGTSVQYWHARNMNNKTDLAGALLAVDFGGDETKVGAVAALAHDGNSAHTLLGARAKVGLENWKFSALAARISSNNTNALAAQLGAELSAGNTLQAGVMTLIGYNKHTFDATNYGQLAVQKSNFESANAQARAILRANMGVFDAEVSVGAKYNTRNSYEFNGWLQGARIKNGGKLQEKFAGVADASANFELGVLSLSASAGVEFARGGYASGHIGLGLNFLF